MTDMIVINGTRYREADAKRLGLSATSGKTVTAQTENTGAPLLTTGTADPNGAPVAPDPAATDNNPVAVDRPAGNGSKADWTDFALANGKTEAELDGLTRDDIAALFPAS